MKIIENKIVENGKFSASKSGLPRSSCLTARNDAVPFYAHVSRHCERSEAIQNKEVKSCKLTPIRQISEKYNIRKK